MDISSFTEPHILGLYVYVSANPQAKINEIKDVRSDGERARLHVAIAAMPEKGKANRCLVKFLAREWSLKQSDFQVVQGETSKLKTVLILGDSSHIMKQILSSLNG